MNPKITFVLGACLAAWCCYDLFVSKEAMSAVMTVIEGLACLGGLAMAVGSVIQMQKKATSV